MEHAFVSAHMTLGPSRFLKDIVRFEVSNIRPPNTYIGEICSKARYGIVIMLISQILVDESSRVFDIYCR